MRHIIKRKQAFRSGLTKYYTAQPCRFGHDVERYVSNGGCVTCVDEASAMRRAKAESGPDPELAVMVLDFNEAKRLITKEDARRVGLAWYCDGKALVGCGHYAPQWLSDDSCKVCGYGSKTILDLLS